MEKAPPRRRLPSKGPCTEPGRSAEPPEVSFSSGSVEGVLNVLSAALSAASTTAADAPFDFREESPGDTGFDAIAYKVVMISLPVGGYCLYAHH